jgi:hypothetical protein
VARGTPDPAQIAQRVHEARVAAVRALPAEVAQV